MAREHRLPQQRTPLPAAVHDTQQGEFNDPNRDNHISRGPNRRGPDSPFCGILSAERPIDPQLPAKVSPQLAFRPTLMGGSLFSVYTMRMARINVYLPDDLARQARAAGMSVSNLTQAALRRELAARGSAEWLKHLGRLPAGKVTHEQVLSALDAAREEFGRRRG